MPSVPAVPVRPAPTRAGRLHAITRRATRVSSLAGVATIVLAPLMAVVVPVPAAARPCIGNPTATSAQFLVGTSGNDVLCGGKANDILTGGAGNDTCNTGAPGSPPEPAPTNCP